MFQGSIARRSAGPFNMFFENAHIHAFVPIFSAIPMGYNVNFASVVTSNEPFEFRFLF